MKRRGPTPWRSSSDGSSWLRPSPIQIGEVRLPVVTSMRIGSISGSGSGSVEMGRHAAGMLRSRS